jgi:ATP-binding cassette, subfamily B, bacterial
MTTFRRLLGFLAPYRLQVVVTALLAAGTQAAALVIPFLTGEVIDAASSGQSRTRIFTFAGLIVLAGVVNGVMMLFRRWLAGRLSLNVEFDLRNRFYGHLQRLSFRFFDQHQTGQLLSRATVDVQAVRVFLGYGLIFFFQHVFTVVSVIVLLTLLNIELTVVAIAIAPILAVMAYRYSRVSHPVLKEVQQRVADVTQRAEENVVGVRVVKSFAQEPAESARFRAGSERIFRQALRAARLQATYVPGMTSLPSLAIAGVLLVGGYEVVHGTLTLGEFFAVNAYLGMLVLPLRAIGMWVGQYQRAMASGERVFEVLDEEREIVEHEDARPLPDGPGVIRFENVAFGYDSDRPVLSDIDLEVAAGQTVALIGPTGCGKTTLTTLIPRFYDVDHGRVLIDGADVRDVTLESLRSQIGIVGQDTFLFSTTVAENIAYGAPGAMPEQIVEAAMRAQAHDFISDLPDGYETRIGERGLTLSGGQRQRIAIARALLMDPRVLILDDATASVDASTEAKIKLALREVMAGRTTLIIAHRLSTISLASHVVVLDRGRVVAQGEHAALLERSPVYQEIYEHGLVDRTFVQLDPDGAPIEKDEDVA